MYGCYLCYRYFRLAPPFFVQFSVPYVLSLLFHLASFLTTRRPTDAFIIVRLTSLFFTRIPKSKNYNDLGSLYSKCNLTEYLCAAMAFIGQLSGTFVFCSKIIVSRHLKERERERERDFHVRSFLKVASFHSCVHLAELPYM